ncbi:unnamed protein product [Penicillium olsonii]|nr:unnamed protein product [Penicillium olsonii]
MRLFNYLRPRREQPTAVLTDEVIPINGLFRYMDGTMELAFKFDDVLEPDKLRQSLERLLQIGNWRHLGGRLRRRNDSESQEFELHIPAQYDSARPGFIFRTSEWDGSITDHPVCSQLPRGTNNLTFLGSSQILGPLIHRAEDPRGIDDLIYTDSPSLFFDQINFSDATLMLVTFPHYLMDVMGYVTFLNAWISVLHGREDEVPECRTFIDDCVTRLASKTHAEKYMFYYSAVQGLNKIFYIFRIIWDKIWYPEVEYPTVCIPGWFLNRLRKEALTELALKSSQENNDTHFVSESDVLLAWLTKTLVAVAKPSERKPLVLMNVFDVRSTVLPPKIAYILNAVTFAYTILPVSQVYTQPLSFLAAQIRQSLEKQRNNEQIEAQLAMSKIFHEKTGSPPMIGTRDMFMNMWSNWSRANFFHLDFSPAVRNVSGARDKRVNGLGVPSCFLNTTPMNIFWHGGGIIFGKDCSGNWWLQWSLRKGAKAKIEELFNSINQEHCSSS